jgi:hypothetical protein
MGDFPLRQSVRNDADHFATQGEHFVCEDPHQPNASASKNKIDLSCCKLSGETSCGIFKNPSFSST